MMLQTEAAEYAAVQAAASARASPEEVIPLTALTTSDVLQTAPTESSAENNSESITAAAIQPPSAAPCTNANTRNNSAGRQQGERLCKQHALHQRRRDRAIFIDRFSRVFFPLSFSVLNIMYWTVFVEYYY
jgi:hypothetical protein